jgi:hypothetical protein
VGNYQKKNLQFIYLASPKKPRNNSLVTQIKNHGQD